jgi:HAD superfamily hydrolase (TIGR01509 family)
VVFDLDGVVWDGEPLYHEAFNIVLEPYGYSMTSEEYAQIIGQSTEAAWAWVLRRLQVSGSPDRFYDRYDEVVLDLLKGPVKPLPGVRELLAELARRGVPVGLATASFRNWVDATLAGLGLEDAFAVTVSASEVEQAKPAPDLYVAAARGLGLHPASCVAIEDTVPGIQSALSAGMYAIQVRASSTALPPIDEADRVIESYADFDFSLLNGHRAG